jgi:hypothetical protein
MPVSWPRAHRGTKVVRVARSNPAQRISHTRGSEPYEKLPATPTFIRQEPCRFAKRIEPASPLRHAPKVALPPSHFV